MEKAKWVSVVDSLPPPCEYKYRNKNKFGVLIYPPYICIKKIKNNMEKRIENFKRGDIVRCINDGVIVSESSNWCEYDNITTGDLLIVISCEDNLVSFENKLYLQRPERFEPVTVEQEVKRPHFRIRLDTENGHFGPYGIVFYDIFSPDGSSCGYIENTFDKYGHLQSFRNLTYGTVAMCELPF